MTHEWRRGGALKGNSIGIVRAKNEKCTYSKTGKQWI